MENVESQARPQTAVRHRVRHPKLAMVSMLLGAFVGMFSETSLNIALPKLGEAFGMSAATLQWLVTGYMLVIGIIMPLSSIIAKWFSTRKIIIFALVIFILGSIISALAPSFAVLLAGRMIQGIGTGLILPLMFAVAMQIFPPEKLGAVNGTMALVIMFAPAIGPTLTGVILGVASWRWIFWFFLPFLVIALLFALFELENVGELTKPHVDGLSILESIIGFSGIAVALTGAIMLPGGIVNAVTSAVAGRMYDNIGAKKPALVGLLIALVGALMLAIASDHAKIGYIIAAHVILMIGAPLAMSPAQTAALNALSGREAGDGSTILNTVQQVVGALATALATSCLELGRHAATGSAQARFTAGAHVGFYFTLALIVIALVVATQLKGRPVGHSIKLDK